MKNIRQEFLNTYLSPQGTLTRYIDSLFIFLCSLTALLVYYSINYELCIDSACDDLAITQYWVSSSIIYLIYSASVFVTGIFVFNTKQLPKIYSIGITLAIGSSFVLSGMIIFAISQEIAM